MKKTRNRFGKKSKYYVTNKELYPEMENFDRTGKCSDQLAIWIELLCERYAMHPWFNGYTYKDEMVRNAVLKIFEKLDKYDVHKFTYKIYTNERPVDEEKIVPKNPNYSTYYLSGIIKDLCEDYVGEHGYYVSHVTEDNRLDSDGNVVDPNPEHLYTITVTFKSDLYIGDLKELIGEDIGLRYGNVHAYFTMVARNEFQKYKKLEHKQRKIRDEILMDNDMEPSYNCDIEEHYNPDDMHSECVITTY